MLKKLLLIGAATIAVPAFAQDKPADTGAAQQQTAPAPTAAPTDPSAPDPAQNPTATQESKPTATPSAQAPTQQVTPPAQTATAPATTPAAPTPPQAAATAPAQPAAPAPAAQPAPQVAAIVGKEYASYDADKSGGLNQAEFGKWMIALRTASDSSFDGKSAAAKTWVTQAFAAADTNKNKAVSQSEMTALLGRSG